MHTPNEEKAQNSVPPVVEDPQARLTTVRNAIAARVRSDSGERPRLTSGPAVSRMVKEVTEDASFVTTFGGVAGFEDIKAIVTTDEAVYLYSDKYLTRQQAQSLARGEEIRARIVERVRADSSSKQHLTPLNDFGMIPGAEPGNIEKHLDLLLDDARYQDVRLISNSRGSRYLYSDEHMTSTYANVLARAEANDPLGTIVTTVREDSRIYPRPTSLGTFAAPIFGMDARRLGQYAEEILARPEYADIKLEKASNGAVYLYSAQYLDPNYVKSTVEWEEVGKYENP